MPKISQFTAQTGASVANGDLFPIVDVGSPNVSEYITADELAQIPQLTSRYVAKTEDDQRFLGATELHARDGSTQSTVFTAHPVWLLAAAGDDGVVWSGMLPEHWTTFHVDAVYVQTAGGSGNVRFQATTNVVGDGESLPGNSYTDTTSTVAADNVVKYQRVVTSASNSASKHVTIYVNRAGDNAADTYASSIALKGLYLAKAS